MKGGGGGGREVGREENKALGDVVEKPKNSFFKGSLYLNLEISFGGGKWAVITPRSNGEADAGAKPLSSAGALRRSWAH